MDIVAATQGLSDRELIEGEHYLRRYRGACRIRFPEKEIFGRFQRLIGIQCGVHICYIG